jgi:hypothetical protein
MDRSGIGPRIDPPAEPATTPTQGVTVDQWLQLPWDEGCQVDELPCLQSITVTTRNSLYEVIVTSPRSGGVKIRGGRFFPEWSEAVLAGCSLGGSFLKLRGLYVGFCMELYFQGQVVVTTRVQTIALHRDPDCSPH